MSLKAGKVNLAQVKHTGFESVRTTATYPCEEQTDPKLLARLNRLDKRERPPVVSNRIICTA